MMGNDEKCSIVYVHETDETKKGKEVHTYESFEFGDVHWCRVGDYIYVNKGTSSPKLWY